MSPCAGGVLLVAEGGQDVSENPATEWEGSPGAIPFVLHLQGMRQAANTKENEEGGGRVSV